MRKMLVSELSQGQKLNNKELCEIFLCSSQGGMRRSIRTNTLVLICNHVSSIYDDRWIHDVLHYTGMGLKGDQSFEKQQNKTLYESQSNGIDVHLFEVFKDKEYTYSGKVRLASAPYIEKQTDSDGELRSVCVFPLILQGAVRIISEKDIDSMEEAKTKLLSKISDEELYIRALAVDDITKENIRVVSDYRRDLIVTEFAKRWANGICQLCDNTAPFKTKKGEPYLEVHHIEWLSKGGSDTIFNTIALCPNCHRKMHSLNDFKDVACLIEKIKIFLGSNMKTSLS